MGERAPGDGGAGPAGARPGHGQRRPDGAGVPAAVRVLLSECVTSYEQIECLVLLADEPGDHTVRAVGEGLDIADDLARTALRGLCVCGLVRTQGRAPWETFTYAPRDAARAAAVELLGREYQQNIVEIVKLITANSIDRMHSDAVRRFAEAFVIDPDRDADGC